MSGDDDRTVQRVITISVVGAGSSSDYTVSEAGRSCDGLCWDEMLGTVAELTHPKIGQAHYRMTTEAERTEREERRAREAARRNDTPARA